MYIYLYYNVYISKLYCNDLCSYKDKKSNK